MKQMAALLTAAALCSTALPAAAEDFVVHGTFTLDSAACGSSLDDAIGYEHTFDWALRDVTYSFADEGAQPNVMSVTQVHAADWDVTFSGPYSTLLNEEVSQYLMQGAGNYGADTLMSLSGPAGGESWMMSFALAPDDPADGVSLRAFSAAFVPSTPTNAEGRAVLGPMTAQVRMALQDQRAGLGCTIWASQTVLEIDYAQAGGAGGAAGQAGAGGEAGEAGQGGASAGAAGEAGYGGSAAGAAGTSAGGQAGGSQGGEAGAAVAGSGGQQAAGAAGDAAGSAGASGGQTNEAVPPPAEEAEGGCAVATGHATWPGLALWAALFALSTRRRSRSNAGSR